MDPCATESTRRENAAQVQYRILNHRRPCNEQGSRDAVKCMVSENNNILAWDGYGVNPCVIDSETKMRVDPNAWTHYKCRQQLPNRTFQAVPKLYRGTVLPGLESRIQNGADTSFIRECDRISEKPWDVFSPAVNKNDWQDAAHIVQSWTWGGESSRDITRSDGFLKSIGYTHNGRNWQRGRDPLR